jgi:hypothetical protein
MERLTSEREIDSVTKIIIIPRAKQAIHQKNKAAINAY